MTWPLASVLLGTLGTLAIAIAQWVPRRSGRVPFPPLEEIVEIRTRLQALERAHHQMRTELRGDFKELEKVVRNWTR